MSIVRTMKTLAAINIRQYERAVESLANYNRTIEMGFQILLRNLPEEVSLAKNTQHTTLGIIIFGSDQGMCGQFNEQIGNLAMEELARLWLPKADRLILALGARLTAYLEALEQP